MMLMFLEDKKIEKVIFKNVFFEEDILKMYFFTNQFFEAAKCD